MTTMQTTVLEAPLVSARSRASRRAERRAEAPQKQVTLRVETKDDLTTDDETETTPRQPFPFLRLPSELRLRIYEEVLLMNKTIDLDPYNFFSISRRLGIFLTCRQIHEEAYRVFYGQTFRLYPTHGRFFHTKKPLLARLPPHYRNTIQSMELRLGPGWGSPPKCQNTNPSLGLADCTSLKKLSIFIECDPSESVFAGFRGKGATEDTYKYFCIDLLLGILEQVPSLRVVEIDAYPSVKKDSPIVLGLTRHIRRAGKIQAWGPLRGWEKEKDEPGLVGLEGALASMNISEAPRLVEVPA